MVSWQDVVLSVAAVVFLLSLVPSVLDEKTRISRRTSIPTALGAAVQGAVLLTLGLVFSGVLTIAIAGLWAHLAVWRTVR